MPQINYMTMIEFDSGALRKLGSVLSELQVSRSLLVTDRGLVETDIVDRTIQSLGRGSLAAIYDGTPSNPTEDAVTAAATLFREAGCDGLVALGGGSPIDLAKAVALSVTHPGPLSDYAAVNGGATRISARTAPVIAIPTTAGTGSEVGRATLIVMNDRRKLAYISPHLIPRRAICDPDLTLGLPAHLTAATGMDAIAHCIETFLSPAVNPPADAIALDGLRRGYHAIDTAVSEGADKTARWDMMMASLQGGLCFQKGLGAVHALSHPLGALRTPVLHHGTLNAILLPAVLRFNAQRVPDKYAALRSAMTLSAADDPADAIERLNERIGLPQRLSDLGVSVDILPEIARAGMADLCTQTNPRTPTVADYERVLNESW